jgi:AcrR family transcriptional regulator
MEQPSEPIDELTTKEKLFNAAVDLFSTRGIHAVSIRDLTREVGIKESSFYNHYQSKDALVKSIYEALKSEFSRTMPPIERIETNLSGLSSPVAFLERGNEIFLDRMVNPRNKKLWRILFIEQYHDLRARDLIVNELIQTSLHYTELVFQTMLRMDLIKPFDPKILAVEYFYPVATMSSYLMSDAIDITVIEKQLRDHVNFFWTMIKK